MDIRRVGLYAALAFVVYTLWTNWWIDYPVAVLPQQQTVTASGRDDRLLPTMVENKPALSVASASTKLKSESIRVQTDVLDLSIDLKHGDVVDAQLLDYPESATEKNKPFALLQNNTGERYIADSSLFVVDEQTVKPVQVDFTSAQKQYKLEPDQQKLIVSLTGKNPEGLSVKKEFTFEKGSYLIAVRYVLANEGTAPWKGYMNTQFLRTSPKEDKSSMFHVGSYTGASYAKPGQSRYKKVAFTDMSKANLDLESDGGWIAMQQHYFLTAWIPPADSKNRFYTRAVDGDYTIGAVSPPIIVPPAEQQHIESRLYLGPEVTSTLSAIAPGLDLTVDYGWLWFISAALFSLMKAIYSVVGNWGWSIVLVTVLIKLVFYKLSATSYKSMAGMRKLQPKLLALRERYGDDKAKISQATMEMYRAEKVNPLGGCLPIVVQIPVFIALYWVLLESVELRQAPFMLWIADLASADPYHVLPVIMGATMLIQQKLNPAPPDPMQAKIMMFLPVLFTGLFWNFPAGLVLYWIVNNSLSILQQWYITRKYGEDKPTKPTQSIKKLTVVK